MRGDGTEFAQTIAVTTRKNKLSQMFIEVVPHRKASTLFTRIEGGTRIWTDGARHYARLGERYKWNSVNHCREGHAHGRSREHWSVQILLQRTAESKRKYVRKKSGTKGRWRAMLKNAMAVYETTAEMWCCAS